MNNNIEGNENRHLFKRLMTYARPYYGAMAAASAMMLGTTLLELYSPSILGDVIDMFVQKAPYKDIMKQGIIYMIVMVAMFIFYSGQMWILCKAGQNIVYNMRNEIFEHIHKLQLGFFDVTPVGKLVTRVTNDVEALSEMFSGILIRLIKNAVKIIGLVVVMLMLNVQLALRAFALVPLIVLLTFIFKKVSRTCYRITRSKITAINTYLSEHISGMRVIQIFNREREKNAEFRDKSNELYKANFREVIVFGIFRPCIYMLSIVALVNIIWGGSDLVFLNNSVLGAGITVGTLYKFIQYVSSFFEPIQDLAEQLGTLQQAFASAEKIFTVLDEKPLIVSPDEPKHMKRNEDENEGEGILPQVTSSIEFDHVWFAYKDEDWVLKDVSFKINPGERVAFVGATGAGKTTILSLVGRYYEINKGRILVDGVDIRELDLGELRRSIGQVQQDVFVFTGDINSNIRLLNQDITNEQIRTAAEIANADTFISKLENGYEEPVSERGATLSAGQRQLLSFARTLAFNPRILVMDEATANIDTETEQLITDALEKLMSGRTTIMVAHRLSTIQHCDCIMVMHKGRLREQGTHQELLAQGGIYKKLYELQIAQH